MKSSSVTIQVKANKQYFPLVLLMILDKVVLTLEHADKILKWNQSQKATELYFSISTVVFFCLKAVSEFYFGTVK